MVISRSLIIQEVKILAAFIAASIIQTMITCGSCRTLRSYLLVSLFTLCLWFFLWRGNSFLTNLLSEKISWIQYPGKRFIAGLVVTIGYTFLAVFFLILFFETFAGFNFGSGYRFTIVFSVTFTLLISLFLHCREFLNFWRKAAFDSARFQRESTLAKYETLKSQVNPEFLFNSLNTLAELVYKDEEGSVRYIKQLADVYRYMLDTREKEIVPLSEELSFLKAYASLLRVRYGIGIEISVAELSHNRFIAPLAIHMILENLLATGVIFSSMKVEDDGSCIRLIFPAGSNLNQNEKLIDVLDKIRRKYSFLTREEVRFFDGEDETGISLPLIRQ